MQRNDFDFQNQNIYIENIKKLNKGKNLKAYIVTYGCQQNQADSEKISGILKDMGYSFCEKTEDADFILFNTCAVREHAELKVFGNIGALKFLKRKKPDLIIALCGCMMQQQKVQDEIKRKYKHVDFVFGPSLIPLFPEMLYKVIKDNIRIFDNHEIYGISEGIPIIRDDNKKAWVTVMYGCNNFCSYCIVPYVRGREISRKSTDIINEIKGLVKEGYKDITLLGQNVNSYGKDLDENIDFADLLNEICKIEGDFWLRFMTSHPKDCNMKLLDTMASNKKIAKQLHLPFQSGSDEILKQMNRKYTSSDYLKLIDYAKKVMPDIVLTSDVIVGFPGETEEQFEDTLKLIKKVKYDTLFTFIYSKRNGTKAAVMENQISREIKQQRFERLLDVQNKISKEKNDALLNKTLKVFVEGKSKNNKNVLTGKTEGLKTVDFIGDESLIGNFINVKITKAKTWSLYGVII